DSGSRQLGLTCGLDGFPDYDIWVGACDDPRSFLTGSWLELGPLALPASLCLRRAGGRLSDPGYDLNVEGIEPNRVRLSTLQRVINGDAFVPGVLFSDGIFSPVALDRFQATATVTDGSTAPVGVTTSAVSQGESVLLVSDGAEVEDVRLSFSSDLG